MTTNTLNNSAKITTKGFLFLVVLFLMSTFSMFAQTNVATTTKVVSNDEVITVEIKTAIVLDDTQLDFMNWFMGSKQSQSTNNFSSSDNNSSTSRKKQIISSGVTPNRVLYRTLLKKVVSQENAIV